MKHLDLVLPKGALVLIADGAKAILARNEGSSRTPNLGVIMTLQADPNPPDREHGRERPGRFQKGSGRRTAGEMPDRHEMAETSFLRHVAREFMRGEREIPGKGLVIIAPPKALAVLRDELGQTGNHILAEIPKDLTKHPLPEIEAMLAT
ncbi:MAG: host attachment family protein [Hyphomicrobiales bacterium]|nr:host attachment family protein [Hyphomicrobiales bacterium]MCZ8272166.1 host attachment protein [Microcystis sp. LE19-4.1E]